jgi:7-cyano-7-deazaguanine synthase
MTKAQIVKRGLELGVPFASTWSCYRGLTVHCGRCPACIARREAFAEAGVTDPTIYVV